MFTDDDKAMALAGDGNNEVLGRCSSTLVAFEFPNGAASIETGFVDLRDEGLPEHG